MSTIGLWQRFELSVENKAACADPHRDVALLADFTRPDGTRVSFWGFYDGGATWRLRFMPDQIGEWRYSARFSDASGASDGSFTCAASDVPGPVCADAQNPVWFGVRGGGRFQLRSLHVGDRFFARNTPDDMRRAFLDWAQAQGYNTLSIASHYLNRAEPGRGQGWDTPRLWPLDAAEFQRAERVLDDLAARRLVVFPFGGFFGRGAAFPTTPTEQELYVRYVLARWGAYWNVLWNVSGPEPLLVKEGRVWLSKPELERMGKLIAALDVFGHAITVHNQTGDDEFLGSDWLSFGTLQGPKTTDTALLHAGLLWNHHPARPLYAQETLWSGNKHGHPDYSDSELRKNAITIIMSAAALNFADNGGPDPATIGDSSSGFSGSLVLADRRQWRHDIVKRVWDMFETIPFQRMRPAPHVVSTGMCLAEPGKQILVYLTHGGSVSLRLGSAHRVQWINAQDAADRRDGGTTTDGRNLACPTGGDDWLLYLVRV
jgi:hypothetical protein